MGDHADLAAMVGFVGQHVAEHFNADRPGRRQAVASKDFDAGLVIGLPCPEGFGKHLRAARGALGQSRAGLLRCAGRAVELCWDSEMRSGEPDPLAANVMHVGEDGGDGPGLVRPRAGQFRREIGWRFCFPGRRVQVLNQELVHAVVGGEHLNCGSAELRISLGQKGGHVKAPAFSSCLSYSEAPSRSQIHSSF